MYHVTFRQWNAFVVWIKISFLVVQMVLEKKRVCVPLKEMIATLVILTRDKLFLLLTLAPKEIFVNICRGLIIIVRSCYWYLMSRDQRLRNKIVSGLLPNKAILIPIAKCQKSPDSDCLAWSLTLLIIQL